MRSLFDNAKQEWEAAMNTQKTAAAHANQANAKEAAAALQTLHDTQAEANTGAAGATAEAVWIITKHGNWLATEVTQEHQQPRLLHHSLPVHHNQQVRQHRELHPRRHDLPVVELVCSR